MKTINTIIQLRRDNESNYPATYVPRNGEVLLIDTPNKGLQSKIGNGVSTFAQLEYYSGDVIVRGYYYSNSFYKDDTLAVPIDACTSKIYIDTNRSRLYIYNEEQFQEINAVPTASDTQAGIVKLYSVTGNNEDGTMTQKAITEELSKKVSITVQENDEIAIFTFE